jgi:uncharacterized damage-inducible protein DinB
MDAHFFRSLVDYNYWARDKLLAAVAQVPEHDYLAARPMDYGSIHGTLAHALGGEIVWRARWEGVSLPRIPDRSDFAGLGELTARWREEEATIRGFLARSDDATLMTTVVAYRNIAGESLSRLWWQTLVHLINHGTHHRSEVAAAITQLGHSPGDLDMMVYFNSEAGRRSPG